MKQILYMKIVFGLCVCFLGNMKIHSFQMILQTLISQLLIEFILSSNSCFLLLRYSFMYSFLFLVILGESIDKTFDSVDLAYESLLISGDKQDL